MSEEPIAKIRLRRWRTNWWAAWCPELDETLIFVSHTPQTAVARADEYFGTETRLPAGFAA